MKFVGFVLIATGIAIILFILINIFREYNQIKSPIPDDDSVKVIFITPTK